MLLRIEVKDYDLKDMGGQKISCKQYLPGMVEY